MFTDQHRYAKQAASKKQISRDGSNISETIQKKFQKEINNFPSLKPTLWQKKNSFWFSLFERCHFTITEDHLKQ